jgi:hypothetical protein
MPIEVKSFASQADEAKDMPNARMEAVNVLGQRVMKLTLAPDWKWSKDIKPIVGTASCQATHVGIIIEGTIHCVCDDGSEATYTAGDAYDWRPDSGPDDRTWQAQFRTHRLQSVSGRARSGQFTLRATTPFFRISAENSGPNLFHQNRTVS